MAKYNCVAYGGSVREERFYVIGDSDAEAVDYAKAEAAKVGAEGIFVETDRGQFVFDGYFSSAFDVAVRSM